MHPSEGPDGISRRRFLRDAGLGTVAVVATSDPALAALRHRRRRPTVAVFGGGVAGLTAAHELAERGFDVTIYERRAWGGKARSTEVPGTGIGGRRPLPSEHSFRLEFGFYQNLPDTMKRIPFEGNPNGVFDNLVGQSHLGFSRTAKRDLLLPVGQLERTSYTPAQVLDLIVGVGLQAELPPDAAAYFGQRMAVFLASCDARRQGQWDSTNWIDFIGADRYPEDYRKILGGVPQFTQASKPDTTAAGWVALAFELLVYGLLGFGVNGPCLRVLNRTTNDAWIDPWLRHLRELNVRLRLGERVTALDVRGGRIAGARIASARRRRTVRADWYVSALPVEYARKLWNRAILASDPDLAQMWHLDTGWLNGVQFYLRSRPQIIDGLMLCADSPWAVTLIPQAQYWVDDFATTYGDGQAREKLSTIIGNWDRPGIVYGKPARELAPEQVVHELWEQIKQHVNAPGQPPALTDDMIVSHDIDPGMLLRNNRLISRDPLVLPTAGSAKFTPDVTTKLPNLLLCGDYLRGDWLMATMEAASYNGRRAANAILERSRSREAPARVISPYHPPEWEPLKRIDEDRNRRGQPNLLDAELSPSQVTELLRRLA